jgi:hypothetical protein
MRIPQDTPGQNHERRIKMRKRLLRILMSAVIPVALGLSAVGVTSASAGTARAVSPTPAAHSSGMRITAASRFQVARLLGRVAGRGTASRTATGIPEASAVSGSEFCYNNGGYACLNSWGGGPWVKVYTGGPDGTQNNYFTAEQLNGSDPASWVIKDTAGNAWNGKCIGDAYNKPGRADTSLDPCGTGWGTNFQAFGCIFNGYTGFAFKNNHWGGWLGPPDKYVNGSPFYLNKPVGAPICFKKSS